MAEERDEARDEEKEEGSGKGVGKRGDGLWKRKEETFLPRARAAS